MRLFTHLEANIGAQAGGIAGWVGLNDRSTADIWYTAIANNQDGILLGTATGTRFETPGAFGNWLNSEPTDGQDCGIWYNGGSGSNYAFASMPCQLAATERAYPAFIQWSTAPTAANLTAQVVERSGNNNVANLTGFDLDGDAVTTANWSISANNGNATTTPFYNNRGIQTVAVHYTPNIGFNGVDTLLVSLTVNGDTTTAQIAVSVTELNALPTIDIRYLAADYGETITFTDRIIATDADGDSLSIGISVDAGVRGDITRTALSGNRTAVSFDYTAPAQSSGLARTTITVTADDNKSGTTTELSVINFGDVISPVVTQISSTVITLDNQANYPLVLEFADFTSEAGDSVAITFSDGVNNITRTVSLSNTQLSSLSQMFDLNVLQDGDVNVEVITSDAGGNRATTTTILTKNIAPTIASVSAPALISSNQDAYQITVNLLNANSGATISATLAGNPALTTATTLNNATTQVMLTFDPTTQAINNGTTQIEVSLIVSGSVISSATVEVVHDTVAPNVNGASIDVVAGSTGSGSVTLSLNGNPTGVEQYRINLSADNVSTISATVRTLPRTISVVADIVYTVGVELLDTAGNAAAIQANPSTFSVAPDLSDDDNDGVTNQIETQLIALGNGIIQPVTSASDSDGDGIPDHYEITHNTDPLDSSDPQTATVDGDGDGISDYIEGEITAITSDAAISNNTIPDATIDNDEDGVPDWIELISNVIPINDANVFPGNHSTLDVTAPVTVAQASYAVELGIQTIPITANTDSDGDGYPDYLEIKLGMSPLQANAEQDEDNDGLPNQIEAYLTCQAGNTAIACAQASSEQNLATDSDNDGIFDVSELIQGSDPFDLNSPVAGGVASAPGTPTANDSDGDGLADSYEQQLGLSTDIADTDGDGTSDFDEVTVFATDATNPTDFPANLSGDIHLTQQGNNVSFVRINAGLVEAQANIRAVANVADTFTWNLQQADGTAASSALQSTTERLTIIDPTSLSAGNYVISLRVQRQIRSNTITSEFAHQFTVQAGGQALADSDRDGVPDSDDNSPLTGGEDNQIDRNLFNNHRIGNSRLQGASSATRLVVGAIAQQVGASTTNRGYDTQLRETDSQVAADAVYEYGNDIYDIQVANLPTRGSTTTLLLTLNAPLGERVVRNYNGTRWQNVPEAMVQYAQGSPQSVARVVNQNIDCSNADYRATSDGADSCIKIALTDGTGLDTDGNANGHIAAQIGIGNSGSGGGNGGGNGNGNGGGTAAGGGGGGCSLIANPTSQPDWTLYLLLILAAAGVFIRKRTLI